MRSNIFTFFRDEEDNDPAFLRITRTLLIIIIVGSILLMPLPAGILGTENQEITAFIPLAVTILFGVIALYLVNNGKPGMAKLFIPLTIAASVVFTASADNGLRDTSMLILPTVLIMSAILLGKRAVWVAAPLTISAVFIIAVVDLNSDKPVDPVGWTQVITIVVTMLASAVIMQILVNRLTESIRKARENEQLQIQKNRELSDLQQSLEDRINQRTAELDSSNRSNVRRARQFEAISQTISVISTIQDLDTLLPYVTQLISEQFNIYHTGIFLLDAQKEFAVLHAANSDGGRKMLMRKHKLRVGETGIIGFVTATGQPRIALDIGSDAVYFNNPDLPDTRSEIGLPLRYAGEVIGALDVQSVEANAFGAEDIDVLLTLADQIAITITNTLALERLRNELSEFQKSVGENIRESWKIMRPKSLGLGFELINGLDIKPLEKPIAGEHIQDALAQSKAVLSNTADGASALAIPIQLRGRNIGFINVRTNSEYQLTSDDTEIVEAVTERLALAIETATLLQTTQHRADIERVTTDISTRISASSRFDTILQTAAQELSRALGGSDVIVQIEPASIDAETTG